MDAAVTYSKTEFSKGWVTKNPELFAAAALKFLEQHPHEHWDFGMEARSGFFSFVATKKE